MTGCVTALTLSAQLYLQSCIHRTGCSEVVAIFLELADTVKLVSSVAAKVHSYVNHLQSISYTITHWRCFILKKLQYLTAVTLTFGIRC